MGTISEVLDLVRTAANPDVYKKVANLTQELLQYQEEVRDLREKVRELERAQDVGDQLVYDPSYKPSRVVSNYGVYWLPKDDGSKEGPFCSRCWEVDRQLVHLQVNTRRGICYCRECDRQHQEIT